MANTESGLSRQMDAPLPVETAILQAIVYADLFDYPLTVPEIHRFLVGVSASMAMVQRALTQGHLSERLAEVDGYVMLSGREFLAETRLRRERLSAAMWRKGVRYGRVIGALPFVRMAAITGTLAVRNVEAGSDIDYLIVTQTGRVWLTRSLCLVLVYLARLDGITICPNYVLGLDVLGEFSRSFFAAHEIAQMVPVYGLGVYHELIRANSWAKDYLPNAFEVDHEHVARQLSPIAAGIKALGEWLLCGSLGDRWERRESSIKIQRLSQEADRCGSCSATFDAKQCKGHMLDHGRLIAEAYRGRLRQMGIGDLDLISLS